MSGTKRPKISKDAVDFVTECFTRDVEGSPAKCNICSKVLMVDKVNNLKRHLQLVHKEVYDDFMATAEKNNNFRSKRKIPTVPVPIDREMLIECTVKMVTSGGLAFNMLDQPGLADLLGLLTKALKVPVINRKTITGDVEKAAAAFKQEIIKELKDRMICLKVDSATRKGKSVISICGQYIFEDKLVMRTLSVYEYNASHTAEAIKDEIIRVMKTFEVDVKQIYAITTENGANYLKAARLLHEAQKSYDVINYDLEIEEINEHDYYEGDKVEEYTLDFVTNAISDSVRCAAHTLQLCVYDSIKILNLKSSLERIKATARQLRTKQ